MAAAESMRCASGSYSPSAEQSPPELDHEPGADSLAERLISATVGRLSPQIRAGVCVVPTPKIMAALSRKLGGWPDLEPETMAVALAWAGKHASPHLAKHAFNWGQLAGGSFGDRTELEEIIGAWTLAGRPGVWDATVSDDEPAPPPEVIDERRRQLAALKGRT
jgi:hypothetical protein